MHRTTERIVAIGTSTGGTQALETVLTALPQVMPGMVIVQQMPEKFTAAVAARLDSLCRVEVREAQNNDRVLPGLKELHETGAMTLAQDEASCVVYGMPKEAVKRGAVERSVPLEAIAGEIVRFG